MWQLIARFATACTCIVLCGGPRAETALQAESPRIALDEAIANALERNPELMAFGYQLEAVRSQVVQAGLAPNPELVIGVEDAAGTGDFNGIDSAETTVSLGWVLERGVRERRVDAANATVAVSTVDEEILRVDVAAETARQFISVLANQALTVAAGDAVRLAEETTEAVRRRVDAGRTPQADLARAEAELATAKLAQRDTEFASTAARYRLAAQWGDTSPDFVAVRGDPFALPNPVPFAVLRDGIEQNPHVARYLSEQRLNEAALRLAEAQRRPAWEARVGMRRMESTDDHALVAGITIPLAVRNRNQGRIAETRALIEQSRADASAARIRIETTLFVLYEALQQSLHRAATLRSEVVPRIESALEDTRAAYEQGRYSYFEWRTVQAELIDARRRLLESSIEAHQTVIEIERLTGARVAQPRPTQ